MASEANYEGMTVNERLFVAGLLAVYDEAKASGDIVKINNLLAKVNLWQDENGMNWSIEKNNAPNN